MKKALLVLISLAFILTSCSTKSPHDKEIKNKSTISDPTTITPENQPKSPDESVQYTDKDIEKIFLPPNFIVTKFDIAHKEKKIEINMDYIFNEKLYNILKNDVEYSIVIGYPEPVQKIINKKNSDIFPGKINSDGRLNYSLSYIEKIESEIDEKQFNKVIRDDMTYQLYILNSKDEAFQIFPTFRYMIDYEEGKSKDLFYK